MTFEARFKLIRKTFSESIYININLISANRPTAKVAAARPRPQPIAGTPPPDPNEKCDANIIQQTCNLFGLDLVSRMHFSILPKQFSHEFTSICNCNLL